jgi:two-component system, CitB family, sensor kinase
VTQACPSFAPTGKPINTLDKETHPATTITVHIKEDVERLYMEVSDTGPGIDPKIGDQMFEDGKTTKGEGRGFGLALVSRLVSRLDGTIFMISTPTGATLQVSLPRMEGSL